MITLRAYSSYIRYIIGGLIALIGFVLMFIPFIPFGYVLIFLALFILAPKVPFLKKYVRLLKRKDKKGHLKRIEDRMNEWETSFTAQSPDNSNKS